MKRVAAAVAALLLVAVTSGLGSDVAGERSRGEARVQYVHGSTQKVCQLTGETDREYSQPTPSQTVSRFGLVGTDRGYSFEHHGKLFFLFGDSSPSGTFNGHPNAQVDAPRDTLDNDAIAFVADSAVHPLLSLDFVTDSIGAFKNPVVLDSAGRHAITLRTNETPIAGFSDGGKMYVVFGTDNLRSNPPGGPSNPNGAARRSVVAVSEDDGNTFHYAYNFSTWPGSKFIDMSIARGQDGYIYFWGTQGDSLFRKSPPFLARKPEGSMGDSTAIEYLRGVLPNGTPLFGPSEADASPIFHDSIPASGGGMQVADCMGEVGVEWNSFVHRWIMLYNSSNNSPGHPRGIWMRAAEEPWGPWSLPQTIFNADSDNGLCYFIHRAVTPQQPACDTLSNPGRVGIQGGGYAPFFISGLTTGNEALGTSTIYFVLSTWNPYNVVILKSNIQLAPASGGTQAVRPKGLYVLNDPSNGRPAAVGYATGLTSSPAYQNDIAGHAIFVPIAKILPSISTWGEFNWDWSYLDTLVQVALSHGKKFSIELETGYQTSSATYLKALPSGFAAAAGTDCAPLFDVWTTGGTQGRCTSAFILLPWAQKVQEFWSAIAFALAAHLQQTGAYASLTLVHVPGLSVYDEEIRLPTGTPRPTSADTQACPDGRPAYPAVITDADTARWRSYGYSDSAVVNGFAVIATAFAEAFPDRYLGLSLFPPGGTGIDFPNLTHDSVGTVTSQIVKKVSGIAPGRVQLQADMLDANAILPEVITLATGNADSIGWQSNKHAGTGAGCDGGGAGSCDPDGAGGPYYRLLQNGFATGGRYLEVWSEDVVSYPLAIAAAGAAGFFTSVEVQHQAPKTGFALDQNYPNPFNPTTTIRYAIPSRAHVTLTLYNLLGQTVGVLVDEDREPGTYETRVDASRLASGAYFYQLKAGSLFETKKLLLLR